jgi:hypothetical protein
MYCLVTDPHGEDVRPRRARLPGRGSLEPDPREALLLAPVLHRERESALLFPGSGQRERDAADVLLCRHDYRFAGAQVKLAASFGSPVPAYFATWG